MKLVLEIAGGEILGVTADAQNVELLVVDYDLSGATVDGQDCRITAHKASADPEKVTQIAAEAARTRSAS